jgi:hypothetical protein
MGAVVNSMRDEIEQAVELLRSGKPSLYTVLTFLRKL